LGVTLGFSGRIQPASNLDPLCEFARDFALENEWGYRSEEKTLAQAALKQKAEGPPRFLEAARWRGAILLPHFLSEWLPILTVDGDGTLTDLIADAAEGQVSLTPQVLVKTQFAGPGAHKEICRFLIEVRDRFVSDLRVDDESGYFESRDEGALETAFKAVDRELRELYLAEISRPSASFEIGGSRFRSRPEGGAGGEFDAISKEMREYVTDQDAEFQVRFGGFGYSFDHSRKSLDDLELVATEADRPDLSDDEREYLKGPFIHCAGAYLGRTLISAFGGSWLEDEDEGWVIQDLAGIGLLMNPFLVVEDRVTWGPVQAFPSHAEWIQRMRNAFRTE
jgi:hypothetical protein